MAHYTADEMARRYQPGDRMLFSRGGAIVMTAETANRISPNLAELDRATGTYRRVQLDPSAEDKVITEATAGARVVDPEPMGNQPAALR
jgi:hypothetical protein